MGRDLYENSPAAREVFAAVDAACGFAVSDLCFHGPEEELKATLNTQPCLFAASVAALAACREAGLTPAAVAGHSVGEYAALVAAGAFDVTAGARLVKARGEAMAKAAGERPGTMAAVLGPDYETVAAACAEVVNVGVVVPANVNAPGQIVISGEVRAVEAAGALLKERGAKRVLPLAVSGAFHSPLMEVASAVMHGVLALTEVADPALPIVANVTADYERTADEVKANLVTQVAGPVRWVETVQRLVADGHTTFVECGPGKVLAGLIARIAPDARIFSVGDTASLAAAREALQA
jgi:[acyl-carrier-protein] S-malonyltransferase